MIDEAIVLRVWEFSETSQTAALFTREHGAVRALAKGSRRLRAPFSGGLDTLTRGEAVWFPRASSDLATLAEWDLREVYRHVRQDRTANAVGVHMADLASRFIHDHDPHPSLYDALHAALGALASAHDAPLALLRFQWALLRETGFAPEVRRDVTSGRPLRTRASYSFDPARGAFAPDEHDHPDRGGRPRWRVRAATVETLRWLDATADNPIPTPDATIRAARLLSAYAATILGTEPATLAPALRALERTSAGAPPTS